MPDQTPKDAPAASQPPAAAASPAPAEQPKPTPVPTPEATPVTAHVWALGNHSRQVLLAGLLADQPALAGEKKTPADWQSALDDYARSERV